MDFAEARFRKFLDSTNEMVKADPALAEKEIIKIQDVLKSPQGFSVIIEFKRS
jgi:hypothetical protein